MATVGTFYTDAEISDIKQDAYEQGKKEALTPRPIEEAEFNDLVTGYHLTIVKHGQNFWREIGTVFVDEEAKRDKRIYFIKPMPPC